MKRVLCLAALGAVLLAAGVLGTGETQTAISADGLVESTSGGFKYPDGSVQATAAAEKPKYIGEFCWLLTDDPGIPDAGAAFLKLGITDWGGGHGSVSGRGFDEGGDHPIPVSGSIQAIGDEQLMTLTITNFDGVLPDQGEFASVIARIALANATLDGTFQATTILYSLDSAQFNPLEFEFGTATYLPGCLVP